MSKIIFLLVLLLFQFKSWAQSESHMDEVAPTSFSNRIIKVGSLQNQLDKYRYQNIIRIPKGVHQGPIHLKESNLKIIAENGAIIDGNGEGTVIVIEGDNIILDGLVIRGSGFSYTDVDAAISIRNSHHVTVKNSKIEDCLFGVDVALSEGVIVENNNISSKNLDLSIRGDAIRFWASKNSSVIGNHWENSRDVVAWYSDNILYRNNKGRHSRYSLHSMYSKNLKIIGNQFFNNSVGIFLMYGSDILISDNRIQRSSGATGKGIGLKEVSNVIIQNNTILYSSIGIGVDNSPFNINTKIWYINNEIAYNQRAVSLSNDRSGGEFKDNIFADNHIDVESNNRFPSRGEWHGNYWDKYDGFDRNQDGIGDTPYLIKKYSDTFRENIPNTSFFYSSPVDLLISLVEQVTNFGDPLIVVRDTKPRFFKEDVR